jgi:sialidase-1
MARIFDCICWASLVFGTDVAGLLARTIAAEPPSTLLFDSGKEGYRRYRIPALLTTTRGTVLAFCEGRKDGKGLAGDIDIVLKRSTDGGNTWLPLQVVADDNGNTLGNPCPVLDRVTGDIWLALTRSHGQDDEEAIVAGTSRETTRVLITCSRDDGKTWAPPRDITASAKRPNWTWYGTGPGIGIQLRGGRLLIPSYHAEAVTKTYRSHMILSDDSGKTWQVGASVGEACSECQVAERSDGSVVLSSRTLAGTKQRTTSVSKDGGQTWSVAERNTNLYDPSCQAALLRLSEEDKGHKARWLYVHPAGPDGRRNLTVRLSHDEGRTWPHSKLLRAGDSQYACLALLPDRSIGCLHESWVDGNYRLFFLRFRMDWLANGKDTLEP